MMFFDSAIRFCRFIAVIGLVSLFLSGCAGKLNRAADSYYSGQPEKALTILSGNSWAGNKNKLLYLLEQGAIYHHQGDYQKSVGFFLEADWLIESYERISLSEQTASLVGNEWLTNYKGEYSERLWVHTYLMMNFMLLGQYDDALVEANRALTRFEKYPHALNQAFFTRALMALSFSNVAEDNDALLIYRQLADDLSDKGVVAGDIVYHAGRLGMMDLVKTFSPLSAFVPSHNDGELVLFLSSGRIPEKLAGNVFLPPSIRFSFPYYGSYLKPFTPSLTLSDGAVITQIDTDLGVVVEDALDARKVSLMAKESIRVAAKEALAQAVGDRNDATAEAAVRALLFLMEEADTRSWKTLPAQFSLIRIALPAGRHKIRMGIGVGHYGTDIPEFELRPGQRQFFSLRFDL
jgi:uncharacterized protein